MQQLQIAGIAHAVEHARGVDHLAMHGQTIGDAVAGDHQDGGFGNVKQFAAPVIEAFGVPALIEGSMYLPEVRTGVTVPAPIAIGFHLVDYVAHGWDVATTLGIAAEFDDEALQLALTTAEAIPAGAQTLEDQTPFRPSVPTPSSSMLDQIIATLGRSPDWMPPT